MLFVTLLLLALLVVARADQPMPGGWTPASPSSPLVVNAMTFAVGKAHPNEQVRYHVLEAKKQVVAGVNWDMVSHITLSNDVCKTEHYRVYDRFGVKSLTTNEIVSDSCAIP
jgi:hypothetical protein